MAWSEEAIQRNRRKRLARRLWKAQPLFAFEALSQQYAGYTPEAFLSDLQVSRSKQKRSKGVMHRYGRYVEMMRLLNEYEETGNQDTLLKAQKLRENIAEPFRLYAKWNNETHIFQYPATTQIKTMKKLAALANSCKSRDEFEEKSAGVTAYGK